MDVREKLVELVGQVQDCGCDVTDVVEMNYLENITLVDHLIAHGVTVQEWISVKDRIPKNFISVLGYMTNAGEFPPVRECYTVGNAFFFPALGDVHPVSHWAEMPQPPKGD